jgi:pyrimidine operon attenuation protein / uracil phosphoribosyltransferase
MKSAARKLSATEIDAALDEMAMKIDAALRAGDRENAVLIGIRTGGVWVAEQLHRRLKLGETVGSLNIAYHRDDFARKGLHPTVEASDLPFDIDDRHVVLVDDILYTGRTVRAALNEIFDYGRPASVMLVVLVDRGGRELPINPDVAGMQMTLKAGEHVKLTGPEPLALTLQKSA